ncbi:MAG TPA: response regulator [Janthinobacterium sp.]|jgi:DNA-binding NtrC family response regulator|nr:response regulator [Janthinobacterium sp.]
MRHILLVDDELNVLKSLKRALRQHGVSESGHPDDLNLELFTDPFEALTRCCSFDFDLVISDQRMPQMMGVDFLRALKDIAPNTVRLMLSAATEFETAVSAINEAQVFRFLPKPWHDADLHANIALALQHRDKLLDEQRLADQSRLDCALTPQEREARRLEEDEPGITHVKWGPDGSISILDD